MFKPFCACAVLFAFVSSAHAEDLYLTDSSSFPGQLWLSEGATAPRSILAREARANRAYPNATMKLAQVAIGPDNKIFYISGLDGYVMHLLDGRNEILSFEFDGQVRDVATTGEEHVVYFSVVPTPQNGARLADGKIYRRDLWEGSASELLTVRQEEVGHAWWGNFTIKGGKIFLATHGETSKIYQWNGRSAELKFEPRVLVTGFAPGANDDFYYTTGDRNVYRTTDFTRGEIVLRGERNLTDVTLRAAADAPRP